MSGPAGVMLRPKVVLANNQTPGDHRYDSVLGFGLGTSFEPGFGPVSGIRKALVF